MPFFMDGFDYYSPGSLAGQGIWDPVSTGTISAIGSGAFAYGRSWTVNTANTLLQTFSLIPGAAANWPTIYAGFHFRFTALGDDARQWIALRDGATNQINVRMTAGGILKLYRNTTLLATGVTALAINTWYWFSFKAVIDSANGEFQLYINGPGVSGLEFNLSALNTQNTANAYATILAVRAVHSSSGTGEYDNFHIYDGADAAPWNAYSTERRIYWNMMDADGNYSDWTPSAGAGWECIDENPPDDDTSYIHSSTPTDRSSFTAPALSNFTVDAVKLSMRARRDDAGPRGITPFTRISGTDYDGAEVLTGATYLYSPLYMLTSPATAAPWGMAELNNAEWGVLLST